jgi:hypothetical protein
MKSFRTAFAGLLALALMPGLAGAQSLPSLKFGSMQVLGPPSIVGSWLGLSQKFGSVDNVTAVDGSMPEGAGHFNLSSAVGGSNPDSAYKTALSATFLSNPGSANGWAQSNVATLTSGGVRRGALVNEMDLNNHFGNITGAIGNPYVANLILTGTNTDGSNGGYSQAALAVEFAQNTNPMWQTGIHFGPAGWNPFAVSAIWDQSNSPVSFRVDGSHMRGLDLTNGSYAEYAIITPGFGIDGSGVASAAKIGAGGIPPASMQSVLHAYVSSSSFQMVERLENNQSGVGSVALGLQATSTSAGETRSAKAGMFFTRTTTNGRGTFGFSNRIANDSADFDTTDWVMEWDNANALKMVIGGVQKTITVDSNGFVKAN